MGTSKPSEKPAYCEFLTVPNELLAKAGPGGGPPDDQALRRAEKAVELLARDYGARCHKEIAILLEAFEVLAGEASVDRAHLQTIYGMAHELRGEAGIYGYTLIGKIASLLCQYVDALGEAAKADIRAIGAHVNALQVADANGLTGDSSEAGRKLISHLIRLHEKVLSQ